MQSQPPLLRILPVDLVRLGDTTASPVAAEKAPLPQEQARELAEKDAPAAIPLAASPAPRTTAGESAPALPTTRLAGDEPRLAPSRTEPKPGTRRSLRPASPAAPADELAQRLQRLAQLTQPPPPQPPQPRRQAGSGASSVTAASDARAGDASYGIKDYIRAQAALRWNPPRAAREAGWTVAIHILLNRDGSVRRADIVDNPRLDSDRTYRDLALSARNAVVLASPFALPPGLADGARDIVLDFDLAQDSR
jgi:hypothetical protein